MPVSFTGLLSPRSKSLALILLSVLLLAACSEKKVEHVRVRMKNGQEYVGNVASRDDKTITVLLATGEARTFLNRQIEAVVPEAIIAETKKQDPNANLVKTPTLPAYTPNGKSGGSSGAIPAISPQATSIEPVKFAAPAAGRLTLRAGTTLNLRPRQVIGAGPAQTKDVYGARILDNVEADGGTIPAETAITMEVETVPGSRGQKMACGLVAIFIGDKEYRPVGSRAKGATPPALGVLSGPDTSALPANIRDMPLRITASSLIVFKLDRAIPLEEVK